ncbi:MAG: Phosphoglycerate mutase [Acidimicrobiaceae bacterium]|nr:Phosphoglycerate mutase [Acidimicrobiaceae bacterium]
MKVWLVRHGESGWNREGLIQGQSLAAPGLTRKGREQVRRAAVTLEGSKAEIVVASDLPRALESGRIIAEHLGLSLQVDRRLRERRLGVAEGRRSADYPEPVLGFENGAVVDARRAPEGAESLAELWERVAAYFADLERCSHESAAVLVSHGGFVRTAQGVLAGLVATEMPWEPVDNAMIVAAELEGLWSAEPGTRGSR